MSDERKRLVDLLRSHYRSCGWKIESADGHLEATGPHGVKWIGRTVVADDLTSREFEAEIIDLADRRMPGGKELRPLDLLPAPECRENLEQLLDRLGLGDDPHVQVYSIAA